jgi:hypothetical protein
MRVSLALLSLLIGVSPALASRHCDMEALKVEIQWCLLEAPEDTPGRERMIEALRGEGTRSDIYFFRAGYMDCQDRNELKLRNFVECSGSDPDTILNFGRELLDLPPLRNGL